MTGYEERMQSRKRENQIREPAEAYDLNKYRYTVRDFYEKPENWRGELIDGVFYEMSSPRIVHQVLCFYIARQLVEYVETNNGDCIVLPLPQDTQLDCDDYTMLEPDISVVCDRGKLSRKKVFGAPDFVIEVLSPPTASRDRFLKLAKYMSAGVREYWIVDSDTRTVMVYAEDVPIVPMTYTFDDNVPVNIWERKCLVDFPSIAKALKERYEI